MVTERPITSLGCIFFNSITLTRKHPSMEDGQSSKCFSFGGYLLNLTLSKPSPIEVTQGMSQFWSTQEKHEETQFLPTWTQPITLHLVKLASKSHVKYCLCPTIQGHTAGPSLEFLSSAPLGNPGYWGSPPMRADCDLSFLFPSRIIRSYLQYIMVNLVPWKRMNILMETKEAMSHLRKVSPCSWWP